MDPPPILDSAPPDKPPRKRGRPPTFDDIKRAQLCAMIESGCSIRYAAARLGINRSTVGYACRKDPAFAERLKHAENERDLLAVRRIHNAGEKSWRAAAWLLERNAPEHFSFRNQNHDPWKHLGKRRLKQLVADILFEYLSDAQKAAPNPTAELGNRLIKQRLDELNGDIADDDDDDHDPVAECDKILRDIDASLRSSPRKPRRTKGEVKK
jgi:hypothetical protein